MLAAWSKSPLVKQTLIVGVGTAIAQGLPLIATPVLTRLYGPDSFGSYGVFLAVTLTWAIVASGRYEMGIPAAASHQVAVQFLIGSLAILLISSAGALGIALIGVQTGLIAVPIWMLVLAPAIVVGSGVSQSLSLWFTRFQDYRSVVTTRVLSSAVTAVVGIVAGSRTHGAEGLAVGAAAGQVAGALGAAVIASESIRRWWKGGGCAGLAALLRSNPQYPRANAVHALVDGIRESGLQAGLSTLYGSSVNGQYGIAAKVTRGPASLIGSALSQVLFGHLARDRREGRGSRSAIVKGSLLLGLAAAPFFIGVMLFGPELSAVLLGDSWRVAGRYAAIMAPGLWANFIVAPFATMPVVSNRMGGALGFALSDLAMRGAALFIGWMVGSPVLSLGLMSGGSVAISAVQLWWYVKLAAGAP